MDSLPEEMRQKYPPIDDTPSSPTEMVLDDAVRGLTERHFKPEDEKELKRKEKVLAELDGLFQEWVRSCGRDVNIEDVHGKAVRGRLETSGSWRLGIHEEGADVDMVCVCPRFCSHDLFFGRFGATLKAHPHVTDFNPIPGAFVPILTFCLRGVEIDLLLAVLPHLSTVPGTFDILEDTVLPDMDEKSRRSLNGPRDTLTIEKLVRSAGSHLREPPDAGVRYEAFLSTVRVVRMWAKRRCLYSNKMGYLGGINFNILVAMIVQMYPRKGVGALLVRFFEVLARWERDFQAREEHDRHLGVRWKVPVRLCDERRLGSTASLDEEVYPFSRFGVSRGDMPVITPSYPAYNSAGNVNPWTLGVMNEELERGRQLGLEAEKLAASGIDTKGRVEAIAKTLDMLVEYSDFFWRADHDHFLALHVHCTGPPVGPEAAAQAQADTEAHAAAVASYEAAVAANISGSVVVDEAKTATATTTTTAAASPEAPDAPSSAAASRSREHNSSDPNQPPQAAPTPPAPPLPFQNLFFPLFKDLCQAMVRNVISSDKFKNLGRYPMTRVHLLPKAFEGQAMPPFTSSAAAAGEALAAAAGPSASPWTAEHQALTVWVAFTPDKERYAQDKLEVGDLARDFEKQVRARFDKDHPGEASRMSIKMGYFVQKELPPWVFDQFSGIGASEAKQRRKADKKARKDAQRVAAAEREAAAAAAAAGGAEMSGGSLLSPGKDGAAIGASAAAAMVSPAELKMGDGARGADGTAVAASPLEIAVIDEAARVAAAAAAAAASEKESLPRAKPLWIAVAEAHAALPVLAQVGDASYRTAAGAYVSGDLLEKLKKRGRSEGETKAEVRLPPPQRIKSVTWLPDEDDDDGGAPTSTSMEGGT